MKILLAGSLFVLGAGAAAAGETHLEGFVRDAARVPVAGARVSLAGAPPAPVVTDAAGRFELSIVQPGEYLLTVEASGFARAERKIAAQGQSLRVEIVLVRAAFSESVAVTGSRAPARLRDTPASVVALSADDLAAAPESPIDEVLRQVPGFTLFRRVGSRTANPTTQGVSLRGVGGSGASRAAVLDDGIPLNDPFGGWIAWGRVPRASLDRIEAMSGGASSLYGGPALSGTVALFRRDPASDALALETSYGSQNTPEASAFLAGRSGPWGAQLAAEGFRTDGYIPVPDNQRGPVDTEVASRHGTLDLTLEREEAGRYRVFLRGNYFTESRENGTPLQVNDTDLRQLAAGSDFQAGPGTLTLRAYGMRERYHQTFSSIAADRTSETLTRDQRVPSDAYGGAGHWTAAFSIHKLVAGLEGRQVTGSSDETVFAANGSTSFATAGGMQRTGGIFVEDVMSLSERWSVTAGARFDAWRNFDASRGTGPDPPRVTSVALPDRSENAFSPRLAVLYRASDSLSLTGSAYKSFRAPTLNELYRSFRLGNTMTLANADLAAERLTGGEGGVLLSPPGGAFAARAAFFWMDVKDPIANVTLSTTPSLTTRQRQNLGETRSRGIELEAETRVTDALSFSLGYLFADSTVQSYAADPTLVGLRVPQVPRHQGTVQARWLFPFGPLLTLQLRGATDQFEDDQNTLVLGQFVIFDALVSVPVIPGLDVFLAGENLLDRRYDVARTPIENTGAPRFIRGGLRLRLGS